MKLEYAARLAERSRLTAWLANTTIAYPFFTLGMYYLEWVAAWAVLGRRPQPYQDSPGSLPIVGELHLLVVLLLLGSFPAFVVGAVANHIFLHQSGISPAAGWVRLCLIWLGWPVMAAVLLWDPFKITEWWSG